MKFHTRKERKTKLFVCGSTSPGVYCVDIGSRVEVCHRVVVPRCDVRKIREFSAFFFLFCFQNFFYAGRFNNTGHSDYQRAKRRERKANETDGYRRVRDLIVRIYDDDDCVSVGFFFVFFFSLTRSYASGSTETTAERFQGRSTLSVRFAPSETRS